MLVTVESQTEDNRATVSNNVYIIYRFATIYTYSFNFPPSPTSRQLFLPRKYFTFYENIALNETD
jgi:hypothetical protein